MLSKSILAVASAPLYKYKYNILQFFFTTIVLSKGTKQRGAIKGLYRTGVGKILDLWAKKGDKI